MATATSPGLISGVCCKCGAIRIMDGVWVRLPGVEGVPYELTVRRGETLATYRISHGYCPTCAFAQLTAIMDQGRKRGEM